MSTIRNGGFELGNTDFWTAESAGTFEVSTVSPKSGAYCGKFTPSNIGDNDIIHKDYIEVTPFDLINLFGWLKSADTGNAYLCIYMYDGDYSYIDTETGLSRDMDGTYLNINTQIPIPEGVKYIRPGFHLFTATTDPYYLDGFTCDVLQHDHAISSTIELGQFTPASTSGDTSNDLKDIQMFETFECDLDVQYVSGTSPTLDVTVYEKNDNNNDVLVGTFTQQTAKNAERITLSHAVGRQLYIKYTIGGTSVNFYFGVYVTGKG